MGFLESLIKPDSIRAVLSNGASKAIATLMMVSGLIVLIGWAADIEILKSMVPGAVTMKANTAISFVLIGLAVLLFKAGVPFVKNAVPALSALLVMLIGAITLLQYVFVFDAGIDQLFFRGDAHGLYTYSPGRMAVNTAIGLIVMSLSVFIGLLNRLWAIMAAQLGGLFIVMLSVLPLLGYAYGMENFLSMGEYTRMALPTAILFLLSGAGIIMAFPGRGIGLIVRSPGPGGFFARRIIPLVMVVPIGMIWLRIILQRVGFDSQTADVAVFFVILVVILTWGIWIAAVRLDFLDVKKAEAEKQAKTWLELMQYVIKHDPNAIAVLDNDLRHVFVSDGFLKAFGIPGKDTIGKHHYEVFPDIPERWREVHRRVLNGEVLQSNDDVFERADGSTDYTRWKCQPWQLQDGSTGGIILYTEIINERKKFEQEILTLNRELENRVLERTRQLEAANKELEAFSYSVSHDLRAPLRAIEGFVSILFEDHLQALPPDGVRVAEIIRGNARKMGELIDGLLAFSRLGRAEINQNRIDMEQLVRDAFDEQTSGAQKKSIGFLVHPLKEAMGDAFMVKQVWINLISNAIKFSSTREHPEITISGNHKDGKYYYVIFDNGVGFDMKYVDKIFGVFQRLHRMEDFDGTGVGLAIVQRVIHRHGGEVFAESTEGEGACFGFSLPLLIE